MDKLSATLEKLEALTKEELSERVPLFVLRTFPEIEKLDIDMTKINKEFDARAEALKKEFSEKAEAIQEEYNVLWKSFWDRAEQLMKAADIWPKGYDRKDKKGCKLEISEGVMYFVRPKANDELSETK
jgi:hypothetical protein